MAKTTVTVACKLPAGLNLGFVTVNGSGHRSAVGGFGLTPNVDGEKFDKWLADHAALPAVAKGLIFGQNRRDTAIAQAREMAELKHGAEAIDPDKPDPAAGIEPTDEQRKETKKAKAEREAREAEEREINEAEIEGQ